MATPKIPFELYVLDSTGKFSTPTTLTNLISADTPNSIPNGLSIGSDNRLLVTPSGFELVSLETDENLIKLTYNDNAGVEQFLETPAINTNVLAIVKGPTHPDNGGTDPTDLLVRSTINGVASNDLDITQLVADINVDSVTWDAATFTLVLTETSPDGGTTPGQTHTINLSSLVISSVAGSITGDGTAADPLTLVGDEETPGNHQFYGTDNAGNKAFQNLVSTLPGNVVTIDPTANTGGVFVGPVIGDVETVTATNTLDIPLDYIGNPSVNLYAPAEFRLALDQATGEPLVGPNGGNLMVALWEQAPAASAPNFVGTGYDLAALANLTEGVPFVSAPPNVTGVPAPTFTVLGASGFPAGLGLSLNPTTGVISGTPLAAGSWSSGSVVATNASGSDTTAVPFVVGGLV